MSEQNFDQTVYFNIEAERYKAECMASVSAVLTVFDGMSDPVELDLASFEKEIINFGRDASNDIVLKSPYVSRLHGNFELSEGKCIIKNNPNSKNGLIFKNKSIQTRRLSDGYSVRIDDGIETTPEGVLFIFSVSGGAVWETVDVTGDGEIKIGRGEDCDIRLDHSGVSRLHAKIVKENGAFWLVDNKSRNGVTVNENEVVGKTLLHEKDLIFIGNSKIVFSSAKISFCYFAKGMSVDALKTAAADAGLSSVQAEKKFGGTMILLDSETPIMPEENAAFGEEANSGESGVSESSDGIDVDSGGDVGDGFDGGNITLRQSGDIQSFQFITGGVLYQLPMTYSDFTACGWVMQDESGALNPFSYESVVMRKGEVGIIAFIVNMTEGELRYEECLVGGIKAENQKWSVSNNSDILLLPGGIRYGLSSLEDILAAYGEPYDRHEFDSAGSGQSITLRYVDDPNQEIELQVTDGKLAKIHMINFVV